MGTHPIFESDFDCLTDMISLLEKLNIESKYGLLTGSASCIALAQIGKGAGKVSVFDLKSKTLTVLDTKAASLEYIMASNSGIVVTGNSKNIFAISNGQIYNQRSFHFVQDIAVTEPDINSSQVKIEVISENRNVTLDVFLNTIACKHTYEIFSNPITAISGIMDTTTGAKIYLKAIALNTGNETRVEFSSNDKLYGYVELEPSLSNRVTIKFYSGRCLIAVDRILYSVHHETLTKSIIQVYSYEIQTLLVSKSNEIICQCSNDVIYILDHEGKQHQEIRAEHKIKHIANLHGDGTLLVLFKNGKLKEYTIN